MTGFLWHCATDALGGHRINPVWTRRVREMGVSRVRYCPQWPDIERSNHWQQVYDDIGTLRDAGLEVFANPQSIPPSAAQGSSCYTEGVGGCLDWIDPTDGSKGLRFTPERGRCSDPPTPDAQAIFNFGAEFVTRFPDLALIGLGNEPDDRISSAAIAHTIDLRYKGDWIPAAEWWTESFLLPFYRGVRSVSKTIPVSGGDFASPGFMAASLRWQQRTGQPAWDWNWNTVHFYAGDHGNGRFPSDTYGTIDMEGGWSAYRRALAAEGIEIELACTESGGDRSEWGGWPGYVERLRLRGDVLCITPLGDIWFKPESVMNADPMKNTYEPNDLYEEMRKTMSQIEGRHRAVRSV